MSAPGTVPVPPPLPRATVRYSLTRGDLLLWNIYGLFRQRLLMGFLLIMGIFMASQNLKEPEIAASSLAYKITFVVVFEVLCLVAIFVLFVLVTGLTILLRRNRGVLGEHILVVTPDGLLERTDVNESLFRWAGFHKIGATRGYLYLYVTDVQVHVVPKRSFASPTAMRAFQDEILKHTAMASREKMEATAL